MLASPAFAKFTFGAGLAAPLPEPVVDPGAVGTAVVTGGVPSPAPPSISIEAVIAEAKVPEDLIQEVLT